MNNAQMQQQMQVPQMQMQQQQFQVPQMQMQQQLFQAPQMQMQQQLFQAPQNNANMYSNAVYTPQQQVQRVQNVRGGMYGSRQPVNYAENQFFNDDEPLGQKVKQEIKDTKIDLQITAQRSVFKLKEAVDLPAMATIKTTGGSRTSVDLICVIDNSGSMSG